MEEKDIERLVAKHVKRAQSQRKPTSTNALAVNKKRHVNERRMAWTSLIFMMVIVLVAIFKIPPEHIANYDNLFTNLFFALSGVVLGYMGFTTWGANKTFDKLGEAAINTSTTDEETDGSSNTSTDQESAG